VPILFVKLRNEEWHINQNKKTSALMEVVWSVGLIVLIAYAAVDKLVINTFFGAEFLPSITPTRILVLCSILDSCSQIKYTELLAQERTFRFAVTMNLAAILSAISGLLLIPELGISGYLIAKLTYSWVQVIGFQVAAENLSRIKLYESNFLLISASIVAMLLYWGGNILAIYKSMSLVFLLGALLLVLWRNRMYIRILH